MNRPTRTRVVCLGAILALIVIGTYVVLPHVPPRGRLPEVYSGVARFPQSKLPLTRITVGPKPAFQPGITNVQIIDFDGDGINDVIACDSQTNRVFWYRQAPLGHWDERVLGSDLIAPAHATVVDLDGDGDRDVVVSVLGNLYPDDSVVGQVVLLENQEGRFVQRLLLDDVRRVADAQAGDLDGDGDLDLAVAAFGHTHGDVLWLENHGSLHFQEHTLLSLPGSIHVPIADYDGDGDLDIATVISQEEEEVWGFENLGHGKFREHRLFFSTNYDLGSGGLVQSDLDNDGDPDLLLPAGDNFEDGYSYPQPYHGCLYLENQGKWGFTVRRIATFGGTYAAAAGDLDGDGDKDVVLVSMVNEWHRPRAASIVWLENTGARARPQFRTWQIDDDPIHMVTVAAGDLNADGRDDIVAGGLHTFRPWDRLGRINAWISRKGASP